DRVEAGGSLDGPKSLDNYYGTPIPEVADHRDVVLEIEVDGASQVKRLREGAIWIFVLPPSRDEQQRRLRGRGDPEEKVDERLRKALDEEPVGLAISDHVVVNDTLERRVDEMLAIIGRHRRRERYTGQPLQEADYGSPPRHDDEPADRGTARYG